MNTMELRQKIDQNLTEISPENLKVIAEFIEFIKNKESLNQSIIINSSETALLSESTLAKEWLKPEEDEAWKNL